MANGKESTGRGDAANDDSNEKTDKSGKGGRAYQGPGPGKIGVTSDDQPGLVAPSGVNERDHGAADDKPMGGGSLNFDDDEVMSGRGNNARSGGTWAAQGADSGELAPPAEILSDRNGPSDRGRRSKKPS